MAVTSKINRTDIFPYSNENATGSFYDWINRLFNHANGYSVVFDKELTTPEDRQALPFPCLLVNQIDTTDPSRGFMSGAIDENSVLFYAYCMVNKNNSEFGTPRLLRRMKDQIVYAVKHAGVFSETANDVLIDPIQMYDFSKTPKVVLETRLTLNANIMQHFIEDTDTLRYELMLNFKYMEVIQ